MWSTLYILFDFIRCCFARRATLQLEVVCLRQQLAVYKRMESRPKLNPHDRHFWITMTRLWSKWRSALVIVKPETVLRWHRRKLGDKLFIRSENHVGTPPLPPDIVSAINKLAHENPLWGAPRIHGEMIKLGFDVSERSVSRYFKSRRTHMGIQKDCPISRAVHSRPTPTARLQPQPILGGLHHNYQCSTA